MNVRVAPRLLLALALVAASIIASNAGATPAGAAPILEPGDAIELANKLAEATEEQGVCYGWRIEVQDDGGNLSGVDEGSSLGPGRSPYEAACRPAVVFTASLHYTSEVSEAADSATYRIDSTLPGFDAGRLDGLGVSNDGLLGDNDDLVVANATALLPVLVAEQGLAPPVPLEETVGTIPEADRPTNTPGSDRWRTHWPSYAFAALLLLAGLAWLGVALYVRYMQTHQPDFTLTSMFED